MLFHRRCLQTTAVFVLLLYSCAASDTVTTSGTIVLVEFYDGRFLVGADSRGSGTGVDPRNPDTDCKITPLGEKMFFAMAGKTKVWDATDKKFILDAHAAAKQAFRQVSSAPNTAAHIKDVAERWTKIMVSEFTYWSKVNEGDFASERIRDNLESAVFGGTTSDGALVAYIVYIQSYYSPDDTPMPHTSLVPRVKTYIIPWNYDPKSTEKVLGSDDSYGVTEFLQGMTARAAAARLRLNQAATTYHSDFNVLTMQFAIQSAVDWAVHKDEVGGKIDILELKKGGIINWLAVKPNCRQQ
jgi:hypothetical protein